MSSTLCFSVHQSIRRYIKAYVGTLVYLEFNNDVRVVGMHNTNICLAATKPFFGDAGCAV